MVLRLILGVVYTAMALGQSLSFPAMPDILGRYGPGPVAASVLAVALIAGELTCGLWFLTRPRSTALAPVVVYTAVSVVWSALALQAWLRGLDVPNCGCFGEYLTQRLSWVVLVQDGLTLFYAVVLLRWARTIDRVVTEPAMTPDETVDVHDR